MTVLVHLTASRFFGGPERQMLGLGAALPADYRTVFASFWEDGYCQPFLEESRQRGFEAIPLCGSRLRPLAAVREIENVLKQTGADVLFCHGYKADTLGLWAARRVGIPAVAVSRGWTGETRRVRLYEMLDRRVLRFMDQVICVSEGQRAKVLRAGVSQDRTTVIHNAVRVSVEQPDPRYHALLRELFPAPVGRVVAAAGRLSPEKGFGILVDAARLVRAKDPTIGFVLFGDGQLRPDLEAQITAHGLDGRFVLAGFRRDLNCFLPHVDVVVLPSFTEGLPNVALEACAAGKPVVATRVGGTPEIIVDGHNGLLVPPGAAGRLAEAILELVALPACGRALGAKGQERVRSSFTFAGQSRRYQELLRQLLTGKARALVRCGAAA